MALNKDQKVAKLVEAGVEVPEGSKTADLDKLAADNNVDFADKVANRYFETPLDGLSLHINDNNPEGKSDPALLEQFRATRYTKLFRGERVRTGLFVVTPETPKRAVELLEGDGNVTELSEEAYNSLVNDPETKLVG